jgi:transposase
MRLYAFYQVSNGVSTRKLEELYNTSFKQIANWVHQFDNEGIQGLKNKSKSGRIPKLNDKQLQRIKKLVLKELPENFGYETATWTGPLVIDWIKKKYWNSYFYRLNLLI